MKSSKTANYPDKKGQPQNANPKLCEPELEAEVNNWSPARRRAAADKFERWVGQLRMSADLLERLGDKVNYDCQLVLPDSDLLEALGANGDISHAEALERAAK